MRISRRRKGTALAAICVAVTLLGCSDGNSNPPSTTGDPGQKLPPEEDLARDILHTKLDVDLATKTATATIDIVHSDKPGASFEAKGLEIKSVTSEGAPIEWSLFQGRLDLGVPVKELGVGSQVTIEYGFKEQNQFEGLMAGGSTLVWPYFCGNLFPCHSNPADGTTFELKVSGTPAGETTVYPTLIPEAPSYQIAWATGKYASLDLGKTNSGTHLTAYYLEGGEADAQAGTVVLKDVFDWYELTYGAYPFGTEAGVVSAPWSAYGGMEHHPLWHVSNIAMKDPWVQAHEAAHGWFGDGVRIACWEDLVLSEGTVSYLEARAIEQIMGATEGQKVWDNYLTRMNAALQGTAPKNVWPDSCGQVDVLKDLFGDLVYMKGAFFFRALEGKIGKAVLDTAIKAVFVKYKGKAARFSDLLTVVKVQSGYDANACAESWLRGMTVPAEQVCP